MNPAVFNLRCGRCPRLVTYRKDLRAEQPGWHNAPVPSFGNLNAGLLIVGLAPGKKGANRTGRPFTGDKAGEWLFEALLKFGFAEGGYLAEANDGLRLNNCRITNAVKCVPYANKPESSEISNCGSFLDAELAAMRRLRAILCLGLISHNATLAALGLRGKDYAFGHGARHSLPSGIHLFDSYHCSAQVTNTKRLTRKMFHSVFAGIHKHLG